MIAALSLAGILAASLVPQTPVRGVVVAGGGGGGGGPFAFVKSAGARADSSTTSITVQLTTVTAGNVIVLHAKHEGSPTTITVSDGTTSFTAATKVNHGNNDLSGQFFYLLSSVASGTVTYTVTFAAARGFRGVVVMEFTRTGTAAFDTEPTGGGSSGTGGTITSGNMTTSVADSLVLGGYSNYGSESLATIQINGVNAGGIRGDDGATGDPQTAHCQWYRIPTATFTGAATATGITGDWIINAIAIK